MSRKKVAGLVAAALLTLMVVFVGVPLFQLWLQTRPIDHTVAHGDDCLSELQGVNFRCWDLHVPAQAANASEPVPLVVDLHGFLNRPSTQREFSAFDELADEQGFVVAWPYGINWSWNSGGDVWPSDTKIDKRVGIGCCGRALNQQIDDVAFIRDMIADLVPSNNIDPDRVYVSGFSNGCALAQRVAAEASDLVAAVGCMSSYLLAEVPDEYAVIPVMVVNGTDDETSPYEADYWPGAVNNFEKWADLNGCDPVHSTTALADGHQLTEATNCTNGANVTLLTLDGQGHVTYKDNGGLDLDTTRLAWEFLSTNAPG